MLQEPNMFWNMLKILLALPVVVLLAYISLRLTNQYLAKHNQGKKIKVIERIPINNKSTLCVVKIIDEYMVLGISDNNFKVIKTLKQEEVSEYLNQDQVFSFTETVNLKKWKKGKIKHE